MFVNRQQQVATSGDRTGLGQMRLSGRQRLHRPQTFVLCASWWFGKLYGRISNRRHRRSRYQNDSSSSISESVSINFVENLLLIKRRTRCSSAGKKAVRSQSSCLFVSIASSNRPPFPRSTAITGFVWTPFLSPIGTQTTIARRRLPRYGNSLVDGRTGQIQTPDGPLLCFVDFGRRHHFGVNRACSISTAKCCRYGRRIAVFRLSTSVNLNDVCRAALYHRL